MSRRRGRAPTLGIIRSSAEQLAVNSEFVYLRDLHPTFRRQIEVMALASYMIDIPA